MATVPELSIIRLPGYLSQ